MRRFPPSPSEVSAYLALVSDIQGRRDAVVVCSMALDDNALSAVDRLCVGDACAKRLSSVGSGIPALVQMFLSPRQERLLGLVHG